MLDRAGWTGRLTVTAERAAAIEGADFVLFQLRIGGQAARHVDETLPHRFGILGQETTGPGGFAKALRTVPVVLDLAEETAGGRRPGRGSWTSPTRSGSSPRRSSTPASGPSASATSRSGCSAGWPPISRVEPERVALEHVGINHLSWERAVVVDGVDRLPELLDREPGWVADEVGLPVELVRELGAIPSYYLRYYYCRDEVLREQLSGRSRAEEVMEIERKLLEMYRDPALAEKPRLLDERGGAFYSEAAAQLIASLHVGHRRRAGGERPERRGAARPPRRRRGRDPGADRPDRGAPAPAGAAAAGAARSRPGGQGLRGSRRRGGDPRRPGGGGEGAPRASARRPAISVARPLLAALLEANRAFLPRFFEPVTARVADAV